MLPTDTVFLIHSFSAFSVLCLFQKDILQIAQLNFSHYKSIVEALYFTSEANKIRVRIAEYLHVSVETNLGKSMIELQP